MYFLGTPTEDMMFSVPGRVARIFLMQHTKTGKNIPNDHKIYQMALK
jgi:hypothetical protein